MSVNNAANPKIKFFVAAGFFQESKHEFLLKVHKTNGLNYHQCYFRSNVCAFLRLIKLSQEDQCK